MSGVLVFLGVAVLAVLGLIALAHWYVSRVNDWYKETRRSSPDAAIARYDSKPWWIRAFDRIAS